VKEDTKKQTGADGKEDRAASKKWTRSLDDGIEDAYGGKGADKAEDQRMTNAWNEFLEDGHGKLEAQAWRASGSRPPKFTRKSHHKPKHAAKHEAHNSHKTQNSHSSHHGHSSNKKKPHVE